MMKKVLFLVLAVISFIQTYGQSWQEQQKLLAYWGENNDELGRNLAISGNYAIVGVRLESEDESQDNPIDKAGAAYIFEKGANGQWVEAQKLVAMDRGVEDYFGSRVAIHDNYALVGASEEDHNELGGDTKINSGAAYIFERDESGHWSQLQKIVASDRSAYAYFGRSLAMDNQYIMIGAIHESEDASGENTIQEAGAVYFFKKDENGYWSEVQKIVASDRHKHGRFGSSVSFNDQNAVIGSRGGTQNISGGQDTVNYPGAAYIFEKGLDDQWTEIQKIVASDEYVFDSFGYSVSMSGDHVIIGAPAKTGIAQDETSFNEAGAAYIFEKAENGQWQEWQQLGPTNLTTYGQFGLSVCMDGDAVVIGGYGENQISPEGDTIRGAGAVSIFKKDESGQWTLQQRLTASDRNPSGNFGSSVSMEGNQLIVGAPRAMGEFGIYRTGAAYIFEFTTTSSIIQNNFASFLNTFPNPSSGNVSLDLGESYPSVEVSIRNLNGQLISTQNFEGKQLISFEIQGGGGIYMIEVKTLDGKSAILKVVKT